MAPGSGPRSSPREGETTLQELWATLWRGRRQLVGVTLAVMALTAGITYVVDPVYESEGVLRIQTESSKSRLLSQLTPLGDLGGLSSLGDNEVETEMGVLRSRRITAAVADSLGLRLRVSAPDRPRDELFRVLEAGHDTVSGRFVLRREGADGYALTPSFRTEPPRDLPARVRIGEPFRLGEMTIALAPELAEAPPEEIKFQLLSFQEMLEEMQESLKVDGQEGGSDLVEVTYRASEPGLAAAVVNGILTRYMGFKEQVESSESRLATATLQRETTDLALKLHAAEERLRAYQVQEGIVAPTEQATQQVRRLAEIQGRRDVMAVERESLAELLATVGRRADREETESPYRQLATFPSFISNGAIQDLLKTLLELENERATLLARRTEENVDVQVLNQRIRELDGQLLRLGSNYLESLDQQIASLSGALVRFEGELGQMPAQEVGYVRLARERELLSEMYLMMQTKLKEAQVQDAITPEGVRVIDDGLVPEEPIFPKPLVNLVLSCVLGLMLGVIVVVARSMASTTIRSESDAEGATAGLPVLGVIPQAASPALSANGRRAPRRIWISRIAGSAGEPASGLMAADLDAWSPTAEAYRSLVTGLTLADSTHAARLLVVTSAMSGDGKSEVAANLALTLARRGSRTLLVDAGMDDTELHRLLGVEPSPGFTDVLAGVSSLSEAVRELSIGPAEHPLHFLSVGGARVHRGSILSSDRARPILEELRGGYDYVLLDAPSLDLNLDSVLLGTMADATLLVARSGATGRDSLEQAANRLRRGGVALGGIVLNEAAGPAPRARKAAKLSRAG